MSAIIGGPSIRASIPYTLHGVTSQGLTIPELAADPAAPAIGYDKLYSLQFGVPASGALLHCDGADSGTTFTDTCGHTFTAVGNAVTATAAKQFGTASLYSPDAVSGVTSDTSTDWKPGTGNWTFDCWLYYPTALGAAQVIFQLGKDSAGYRSMMIGFSTSYLLSLWLGIDGAWSVFNATVGTLGTNSDKLQVGMWNHVLVTRNGYEILGFMNGQLCSRWLFGSTPTASGVYDVDTGHAGCHTLTIGAARKSDDSYYTGFTGYMDEVRWYKGATLYPQYGGPKRAYPIPALSLMPSDGIARRIMVQ